MFQQPFLVYDIGPVYSWFVFTAATQQDISTQDRNAQAFYLKLGSNTECNRAIVFLKDAVSSCQDYARSLVLVARPPSKELLG